MKPFNSWLGHKKEKKKGARALSGHASSDWQTSQAPPPSSAKLGTKPLTQGTLEDILDPNYHAQSSK
jgi:hypothetical protein